MARKKSSESREFDTLKEVGYELEDPQDEFSYQPSSGSSDDGGIGRDEYGIDVDSDAQGRGEDSERSFPGAEDPSLPIPGESEWSQDHRLPNEEIPSWRIRLRDEDLFSLVNDRILHHPQFENAKIVINVESGVVLLKGDVSSEAAKLLGSEIVSALPGVSEIRNELQVVR